MPETPCPVCDGTRIILKRLTGGRFLFKEDETGARVTAPCPRCRDD